MLLERTGTFETDRLTVLQCIPEQKGYIALLDLGEPQQVLGATSKTGMRTLKEGGWEQRVLVIELQLPADGDHT